MTLHVFSFFFFFIWQLLGSSHYLVTRRTLEFSVPAVFDQWLLSWQQISKN